MQILIGDSGSTKTDWAYLTEKDTKFFTTKGLNPNHLAENEIQEILRYELGTQIPLNKVKQVFFYGAGLGNSTAKSYLQGIFRNVFADAENIMLFHDLLGAAHALYGEKSGIVCILGTGSVAGYFDGHSMVKTTGGLGYLLGDEGSGTYLGKLLIREYAQQKLPEHLETALYTHIQVKSTEILHFLYKQSHPNRFLAQLTYFLLAHKEDNTVKNIIYTAFEDFYIHNLFYLRFLYPEHKNIRCVGSVAYLFEKELRETMQKYGIVVDKLIQKPVSQLAESYRKISAFPKNK